MTASEIEFRISAMQTKRVPNGAIVWMNANGTFSHHKDPRGEFLDEAGARASLRFTQEWAA